MKNRQGSVHEQRTFVKLSAMRVGMRGNLAGPAETTRLRVGVIAFAIALAATTWLFERQAPVLWRVVLVLPFFVAVNGLYMGLFRTCSGLAMRGMRDVGDGPEPIISPRELAEVRRRAFRTTGMAALTALSLTAALMALPRVH